MKKTEDLLKRFLKRNVKINVGLLVSFMITGNIIYADIISSNNNIIENKEIINEIGIDATEKSVDISDEINNIYATKTGILASGTSSVVNIDGKENNIIVTTDETKFNVGDISGIEIKEQATVNIGMQNKYSDNNLNISMSGSNLNKEYDSGKIFGVKVEENSNFNVKANNIIINSGVKDEDKAATNVGIYTVGNTNITAKGDIMIGAYSNGENYGNDTAIETNNGTTIINGGGNLILDVKSGTIDKGSGSGNSIAIGIFSLGNNSITDINVDKGINITLDGAGAIGINANYGQVGITAKEDINFKVIANNSIESKAFGAQAEGIMVYNYNNSEKDTKVSLNTDSNIFIEVINNNLHEDLFEGASAYGVAVCGSNSNSSTIADLRGNDITIIVDNNSVNSNEDTDESVGILVQDSNTSIFKGTATNNFTLNVTSTVGNASGIQNVQGNVTINASNNINIFADTTDEDNTAYAIFADSSFSGNENAESNVTLNGKTNQLMSSDIGIYSNGKNGNVSLNGDENYILAGKIDKEGFGDKTAISALGGSNVILKSAVQNNIAGTIYANGEGTNVELISSGDGTNNIISSTAHGTSEVNQEHIVSAVYAQKNSNVTIDSGENGVNIIQSHFDFLHDEDSERTIWAQQGGNINISGQTYIIASSADINTDPDNEIVTNSRGIALTAGSGEGLDDYKNPDGSLKEIALEDRSTINLNYSKESRIIGDVVSGYGGLLNITPKSNNNKIIIQGNILAGNQGQANVNLGNGGIWYGRADDYGDADSNHETFFNPAFSNEIIEGGEVNLTMGDNSTWYVQGQSWITSINIGNSENVMIDLVNSNTDKNSTAHALTIKNLNGNANFHMSLDGNRDVSDVLYIKNANGKYNISLEDVVTEEDMFANGLSGLRFATVGTGSNVEFNVGTVEKGIFNIEYEVETDSYEGNKENNIYTGNEMTSEKPGNSAVDDFFKNDEEIKSISGLDETTNFKIVGKKEENINDGGKTIIEMSKANYAGAVYMDNLNKRLGDMTFADGKEGFWIRLRNDRVGEDDEYRLHNYMTQLGYDKPYSMKEGKGTEYRGIAFEYTKGDMEYKNIKGDANIEHQALWLYDTNIYNNGLYSDYVFRVGRMASEFNIYGRETGAKVEGDYKNLFLGASVEYGYRMNLSDKTYFEPQFQLQYTYIDGTDYTTNQNTKVSLDEIHSAIGRTGFRFGYDFYDKQGKKSTTLYTKANMNYEFLGEQEVKAKDLTGTLEEKYENDGSWYDIGIGLTKEIIPDFNISMDIERQVGREKDNQSWQFNLGFRYVLGD